LNSSARPQCSPPLPRLRTDLRAFLAILSTGIPPVALLIVLIAAPEAHAMAVAIVMVSLAWVMLVAFRMRADLLHHIRTLSNLVEATRAQDYSMKSPRARETGELAELYRQINTLTDSLKVGRQSEQELLAVLEQVVNQIGVAIIVCDSFDRIRLANGLAGKLLQAAPNELIGVDFANTALAGIPLSAAPKLLDYSFPGGKGRWQMSQQYYRHLGKPSRLIFVTDLKQVLSEEEIAAWQRLIRVISHEVNNSLTPITSLCQTLSTMLGAADSARHTQDVRTGLKIIAERAKGLKQFISVYARIARLPEPQKVVFSAAQLLERLQGIFSHGSVELDGEVPDVRLFGDPVHIEQALINLLKNALEANEHGGGPVKVACRVRGDSCEFEIVDDGAGISNPGNLFVPFYTTKAEGAGIGLVLCRQIAARHQGRVTLESRPEGRGAIARFILPLATQPHAQSLAG
jgi:two-component system, NtrC family, nitrogen regulation sensor histidine kinase NtrY